jgi:hypothetical protein
MPKQTIIEIPYTTVQAALDDPTPAAALKQMLLDNAPVGWSPAELNAEVAVNNATAQTLESLLGLVGELPLEVT